MPLTYRITEMRPIYELPSNLSTMDRMIKGGKIFRKRNENKEKSEETMIWIEI